MPTNHVREEETLSDSPTSAEIVLADQGLFNTGGSIVSIKVDREHMNTLRRAALNVPSLRDSLREVEQALLRKVIDEV